MEELRYPIGRYTPEGTVTLELMEQWIRELEAAPANLRTAVTGLTPEQLDTPYRPDGWTVRQVVHHVPDSHMNGYIRFRLALTEDQPIIKPYHEDLWANLHDAKYNPVEPSLALLEALHARWCILLRSLAPLDFKRAFRHPESGDVSLEAALALYAWHGKHHVAHITRLRERMGWL